MGPVIPEVSPEIAYLRARYDEEEAFVRAGFAGELDKLPTIQCRCGRKMHLGGSQQDLADLAAKRKILDLHESWPVLVEREPVLVHDVASMTVSLTQDLAWLTTQEYRKRFGIEPPTSPVIHALLQPYASRPDFPGWFG